MIQDSLNFVVCYMRRKVCLKLEENFVMNEMDLVSKNTKSMGQYSFFTHLTDKINGGDLDFLFHVPFVLRYVDKPE